MLNGMYHYEGNIFVNGKKIPNATIDACPWGERYEIMVFKHGSEYECVRTDTIDEAKQVYDDFMEKYTTPPAEPIEKPLTGKYKKLSEDLKKALAEAKKADFGEDGGTCNFDAPAIYAPRWRADKVEQAAKEAGTTAFKWDWFGRTKFVFGVPTNAQGNRRTRVASAMRNALMEMGYETIMYMSMD